MKKKISFGIILSTIILLSSCRTIEEPNYAIDFQGQTTPVMMNEPAAGLTGIETSYSSGKQRTTVTSSSSSNYGSTTVSASATAVASAYINTPISQQLMPMMMLAPDYIYIKDFTVSEDYSSSMLVTSSTEVTTIEINALIAK